MSIAEATVNKITQLSVPCPFPDPLPTGVRCIEHAVIGKGYRVQRGQCKGLLVLADVGIKKDGKLWYHVSFSYRDRIPSYQDMAWVKKIWFGDDRWAIQVFPEKGNHVNVHPNCLHLWHCLEDRPFPEFSTNGLI
jgi:hypothetical protein